MSRIGLFFLDRFVIIAGVCCKGGLKVEDTFRREDIEMDRARGKVLENREHSLQRQVEYAGIETTEAEANCWK